MKVNGQFSVNDNVIFTGFTQIDDMHSLGSISVVGSVCASDISCSSDIRLKRDIRPLDFNWGNLSALRAVHYTWKDPERGTDLQSGLIAQEVQKLYPELVQSGADGYLSVNYIGPVPHLIEGLKDPKAENTELKEKVAKLETLLQEEIENLEAAVASIKGVAVVKR
ncbi:tail fiber domain-containing protein [Marinilongibacter aquaticus]|uniref:tail fiber domain-containing protein n=1 Tax=Marinilongibacter aquaticus TaxID=2975157 RepID=UPI0021BD3944|nr:tail fiber domain-containing protein [Marinilongibacter aquaticus]UBM58747.1 tail fiber domain-containing protein [Marinilongibacter aquaticus]